MKVLRGTPKHLSKTGQLDSFTYLMINLPFECNYRCPKCFNLYEDRPKVPKESISLDEVIKLINDTKELGGKAVVMTGEGEPSLHKGIRKIVTEINSLDMVPIVYSNGSVLDKEFVRFYKENNTVIVFSLDSLDLEKYDKLTRTRGNLKGAVKNIETAIEEYRSMISIWEGLRVLSVAINTTISSINEDEVEKIKQYFGDDAYFICNPLARLGNAVRNWDSLMDKKSVKNQKELIKRLSESGGPLMLGNDGLCAYFRWGIAVSPSGDYMTCAYTNETDGLLGNIKTTSLKEAFENKHKIESLFRPTDTSCLVRSSSFGPYLKHLRRIKNTDIL